MTAWAARFAALRPVWPGRLDGALAAIGVLLLGVTLAEPSALRPVVVQALESLASTAPFILFAVLAIGFLKATGAERVVAGAFVGHEARMIVFAAVLGGLAPFCSCEVIPFIAGLLAMGAPLSAIMAFWLSSPLIDPVSLSLTAGALGWHFALAKAGLAVALGLFGGAAMAALMRTGGFQATLKPGFSGGGCGSGCGGATHGYTASQGAPVWRFWREPARRAVFVREGASNGIFLLKWLSLAYLLESMMLRYVPADAIASVVGGDGLGSIAVGALVGAPAYLNAYAAPPLVSGLMAQGMSPGAAMAFMVAGGVSCIPAMAAIFALVRARVFAAYVLLGLIGAILAGVAYGALAPAA